MTFRSPRFSIITPVFDPPHEAFEHCIATVQAQTFGDWEWCLVDDKSNDPWIRERLLALQIHDRRIRVHFRKSNGGIVEASNDALGLATGEFVAFLDNDDELHHQALELVDETLCKDSVIDYVYTDEDKITETGKHYDVFFKPRWSPERFLAQNYCSHLSVIRRSLVDTVGRFRAGFDGSQDYDLFLRVAEHARKIAHIPQVLYHWRALAGSTAKDHDEKPYAFVAAMKAVREALMRRGVQADVEQAGKYPFQKVVRRLTYHPRVSIVIPTCGTMKDVFGEQHCLVLSCVRSILNRSSYPNYEIIVVADTVSSPESLQGLHSINDQRIRVVDYDQPFNFSAKCNLGAVLSESEFVLFLNDDTMIIDNDWLEVLVGYMEDSDVAMAGPMLLLENHHIQSAGHANNPTPHNFRNGFASDSPGEFGVLAIARECEGVTGACMLVRRSSFNEVGGMSIIFPKAFNDVDLCYKLLEHGYRIIWTPYTRLFHFETASRPDGVEPKEVELLDQRWRRKFGVDELCRLQ